MDNCLICTRKIVQHAHNISCSLCSVTYHLKCISIVPEDTEYIELHRDDWYCSCCLLNLFPLNNLENVTDLMSAINYSLGSDSLRYLSDKIFLPFQSNDSNHKYGNDSIDPDLNYFRPFNQYVSLQFLCRIIIQLRNSQMPEHDTQHFPMCHLNDRSLRKNLGFFEILLDGLQHIFSSWSNGDMV